jgi:endonuclease/exonuclease/phosphatase family metal-dependent hydrolase
MYRFPTGPFICWLMLLVATLGRLQADINTLEFRVMTWNIWHGGREDGKDVGPRRVIEVIRNSKADLVALQETYGSGELIAKELGFRLLSRGTNLSIHSRYPILEDVSVFEAFKCVGALVQFPGGRRLILYSIWLPYGKDIWVTETRAQEPVAGWVQACQPSAVDLFKIQQEITTRLADPKYQGIPVIIAGDFNSMSHLDYTAAAKAEYREIVDWPTSRVLTSSGYRDAYRTLNPTVNRLKDRTWSPRFPDQEQDRIDFIYFRGAGLEPLAASILETHAERFPSDHAAVLATFRWTP